MIYKAIGITYYPSGLGSTYNCTITDQKQTNVTKSLLSSTVFLYDLNKASNTSAENDNTVSVSLLRNSGNIELIKYTYISNSITTSQNLVGNTSLDFTIPNLRDPGAKIIIYGGGTITYNNSDSLTASEDGKSYTGTLSVVSISNNYYPGTVTLKVKFSRSTSSETYDYIENWYIYWGDGTSTYNNSQGEYTYTHSYSISDRESLPSITLYVAKVQFKYVKTVTTKWTCDIIPYAYYYNDNGNNQPNLTEAAQSYSSSGKTGAKITAEYTHGNGDRYVKADDKWFYEDNIRNEKKPSSTTEERTVTATK